MIKIWPIKAASVHKRKGIDQLQELVQTTKTRRHTHLDGPNSGAGAHIQDPVGVGSNRGEVQFVVTTLDEAVVENVKPL
jgi:hypothetical protein